MGDPGNPSDPSDAPGTGPDPNAPGWASPTPPPPAAPAGFGTPPPPPTVPAGTPGAAGWTPPPGPVRKRRLTWLWILIPVLVVFFASVVLIIVFAVRAIVGPIEASDDYFAALRDERYAEAYDMRCASYQAQITEDQFVQREQENGPVRSFDLDDFDVEDGDDATTRGEVERAGITYDVTVRLEKEDGDWKVCEIEADR